MENSSVPHLRGHWHETCLTYVECCAAYFPLEFQMTVGPKTAPSSLGGSVQMENPMIEQCVIAEFKDVPTARLGLEVLAKAGFGEKHVSFVGRSDAPELKEIGKLRDHAADNVGNATGAGIGGLLGGAMAAPMAASTLLGPFILVGPLVGVGLGAALGGLLGGAQNWGVDQTASESYEEKVKAGSVLVIVTGDPHQIREATASLKTTGPNNIEHFAPTNHD